ncbi:MAG TPA: PA domain-containing protein, partial [Ilumatobacteraceae bacterium]|nr:PA domain-containing protein [Ilumatobacteraceae bacterium]
VHSVFGWQDGDKAYAVMVDNEEATDVDIVDITNPRKPELIAEHDLADKFPQIVEDDPGLTEVFLHDMIVKEIGGTQVMLLSYWDGGYVLLDVEDPANPVYLGDSDFGTEDSLLADGKDVPPEGNAHQAEFTLDNKFVIAADEDFSPFALTAQNVTKGTELSASPGSDTKPLAVGEEIAGQAVFAGRACDGDDIEAAPDNVAHPIAVVERGLCDFTQKVTNVVAAGGYEAILIFNRTAADGCESSLGMTVAGDLPTFGVAPRSQGYAIFGEDYDLDECLAGDGSQLSPMTLGTLGDSLTFSSYFDGWGFVRLLDPNDEMKEIGAYAIDESRDSEFADGFGDLSVHEVATSLQDPGLAYLSYYAGGLRVIEVNATTGITEVAAFIDEGGNNFWGIEAFERDGVEYVAASDRDKGLYIFQYTPEP